MATTIGRVDFIVGLDGRPLPAQARKAGAAGGKAAASGFEGEFTKSLGNLGRQTAATMKANGRFAGISFTDSLAANIRSRLSKVNDQVAGIFADNDGLFEYAKGFDSIGAAADSLFGSLTDLRENNVLSQKEFDTLTGQIERAVPELEKLRKELDEGARVYSNTVDEARKMNREFDESQAQAKAFARELDQAHRAAKQMNASLDFQDGIRDTKAMRSEIKQLTESVKADSAMWEKNEKEVLKFRASIITAHDEAIKMNETFDESARRAAYYGTSVNKLTKDLDKGGKSASIFNGHMRRLPHGARQFAFYVALFAALASQIAVLGSVAGSSIAVLATTLVGLGVAAGVGISAFKGMLGAVEELPEGAREAASAMQALGKPFLEIQDRIQEALFRDLGDDIARLGTEYLPVLSVGLEAIAGSLGVVGERLITSLTAPANLQTLETLLLGLAPIITTLGDVFINFGTALGLIFVASLPTVQAFATGLADMGQRFAEFLASTEGQAALTDFFDTIETVMPYIISLFGAIGDALASLVTPETIALFIGILGNLEQFMPSLAGLLEVIALADPIGLIAGALNIFGQIITPLLPLLAEMAVMFRDNLIVVMLALAPVIQDVLTQILPLAAALLVELLPAFLALLPIVVALASEVLPPLIAALISAAPVIVVLAQFISGLLVGAINMLGPAFEAIGVTVTFLIELVRIQFQGMMDFVSKIFEGDIPGAIGVMQTAWNDTFQAIGDFFTSQFEIIEGMAADVLTNVQSFFDDMPAGVQRVIDDIVGFFIKLPGRITSAIGGIGSIIGNALGGLAGLNLPKTATGGLFDYAQARIIGEAGPEAVVPLNRPLSQVDPAVRALSAYAQGLPLRGEPGGGSSNSRSTVVESGAIQVITPAEDPAVVAAQVLDRLVVSI